MKIGLISLGCSKNLCDSEVMLGLMEKQQLEITNNPAEAEIIIVNTCGFIEAAKEESINTILQMAAYKKDLCRYLIVTGCLAQRYARQLLEEMPEIDAVVGTNAYEDIVRVIERLLKGERVLQLEKTAGPVTLPANLRKLTTPSYMAYLKIAEGCDNFCSFCAIPFIRGRYVSKPYEEVLAEAKYLVSRGVKELILIAQDTTRYGEDLYKQVRLAQLLKDLNDLEGLKWIRVMYCYPNNFNEALIEAFATLPKVCKYVDLPLQHASDRLLNAMHRYDKKADVKQLLHKLRQRIPGIAIRTTFIVGFPGETEADFAELKEFVQEERFENAGVFTYSQEENTVAAKLPGQIPDEVKQNRYHELMSLQASISEEIRQQQEGREFEVLVEGYNPDTPNLAVGRSYREAPEIDGDVFIENAPGLLTGQFVQVRVAQGFTYETVTELVQEPVKD